MRIARSIRSLAQDDCAIGQATQRRQGLAGGSYMRSLPPAILASPVAINFPHIHTIEVRHKDTNTKAKANLPKRQMLQSDCRVKRLTLLRQDATASFTSRKITSQSPAEKYASTADEAHVSVWGDSLSIHLPLSSECFLKRVNGISLFKSNPVERRSRSRVEDFGGKAKANKTTKAKTC